MPAWAYLVIDGIFFLVGIYYLILGCMDLVAYIKQRNWIQTRAEIVQSKPTGFKELFQSSSPWKIIVNLMGVISAIPVALNSNTGNPWFTSTRYSYTIKDQSYTNEEIIRHGVLNKEGEKADCMVNPANHFESSFGRRSLLSLLNLFLGLLILGVAIGMLYALK